MCIHSYPASLKDAWQYDYYYDWNYAVKLDETGLIMNQSAYYLDLENKTIEGLKPGEHLDVDGILKARYDKEGNYFQVVLPRAIDSKMVAQYKMYCYHTIVVDGEEGMIWDITMELVNGATIYFNATLEPFSL